MGKFSTWKFLGGEIGGGEFLAGLPGETHTLGSLGVRAVGPILDGGPGPNTKRS